MSDDTCQIVGSLQIVAAGFAFAAAVLWFISARVCLPERDEPRWDADSRLLGIARKQASWSTRAAVCAGISAVTQGILVWAPSCFHLSAWNWPWRYW